MLVPGLSHRATGFESCKLLSAIVLRMLEVASFQPVCFGCPLYWGSVRACACPFMLFFVVCGQGGGTGWRRIQKIQKQSNELLTQQPWRLICVLYIGEGFGAASGISCVGLQD